MDQIVVNEVDWHRAREAREALLGSALDVKRPDAWRQYGYPEQVTFPQLLQAYERGGAGHGAVHRLLEACWQALPRIKPAGAGEEVTPWETKLQGVLKACAAWGKLRGLDRRNLVGRYGAAILRMRDGKALREPLEGAAALVDVVPVYEDQIRVTDWHSDPTDPDSYGKPRMLQFQSRRLDAGDQGQPVQWQDVHPSRVLILAEGAEGDDFLQGVPLLRAGFNSLLNLEKIEGGSGESYLKNSARTVVFEYERDATLTTIGPNGETISAKAAHEDQARRLNRNTDAAIVLQGGKASTLPVTVADPRGPWEIAACSFAASVRIPFTILFGQQTGRLASDEDRADFQARCKSRQTNELTPMLEQLVKRLQACGIVDAGEFVVEWPDLAAPTDAQKLEHAKGMAEANKTAPGQGGDPIFDVDEIRQAAGYKARAALLVGEGGDPGGE